MHIDWVTSKEAQVLTLRMGHKWRKTQEVELDWKHYTTEWNKKLKNKTKKNHMGMTQTQGYWPKIKDKQHLEK